MLTNKKHKINFRPKTMNNSPNKKQNYSVFSPEVRKIVQKYSQKNMMKLKKQRLDAQSSKKKNELTINLENLNTKPKHQRHKHQNINIKRNIFTVVMESKEKKPYLDDLQPKQLSPRKLTEEQINIRSSHYNPGVAKNITNSKIGSHSNSNSQVYPLSNTPIKIRKKNRDRKTSLNVNDSTFNSNNYVEVPLDQFEQDRIAYQANKSQYSRSVKDNGNQFSITNSLVRLSNHIDNHSSSSFAQRRRRFKNTGPHTQVFSSFLILIQIINC